jgi:dolichyl-phosphate-mannose--protein O-mannosyl transferase
MSQWWEWPTQFGASTVPFAATREGGQIKALGNPAVWLGSFGNFCVATVVGWGCALLPGAARNVAAAVGAGGKGTAALDHPARGWLIPFVVLWAGYLLNLVPYQLIARSKFVYHYIPALMVGVLLFALSVDFLLAVVGGRAKARVLAALIAAALFATVAFAFYFWNVPYGYGYRISPEQGKARLWSRKW